MTRNASLGPATRAARLAAHSLILATIGVVSVPGIALGQAAAPPSTPPATAGQEPAHPPSPPKQGGHDSSRITDQYIPLALEGFPARPKPLLELGQAFLGTGPIHGFEAPGGAVWTPSFLLFGTVRTGVSSSTSFNAAGGEVTTTQWANRFDLFGNLTLTFTERFVFGLRPIDRTDANGARRFTGYFQTKTPTGTSGDFFDHTNFDWGTVSHLFFEGDFGEIFPGLDRDDSSGLDYGLAIGRQPINFQEGTLINDTLDVIGITRNNLTVGPLVNTRIAGLFAWNHVNRNTPAAGALQRNREGDKSRLHVRHGVTSPRMVCSMTASGSKLTDFCAAASASSCLSRAESARASMLCARASAGLSSTA